MTHSYTYRASILFLSLGAASCGPSNDATGSTWLATAGEPRIFRLEGTLTAAANPSNPGGMPKLDPSPVIYVRVFAVDADHGTLRLSGDGVRTDLSYHVVSGELVADAGFRYAQLHAPCSTATLDLDGFTLHGFDDDGDGRFDRLEGSAHGSSSWVIGDVGSQGDVDATFTGAVDVVAPSMPSFGASPLHPLAPLDFGVNVPVTSAPIDLVDATTSAVVRADAWLPVGADALTAGFSFGAAPLPWGASLRADTTGIVDERGLGLEGTSFTVADAPGVFDTPTFEGTVHALLDGATLAPTTYWFPTFEGTQALQLTEWNRATFQLDGTARTTLVVQLRVSGAHPNVTSGTSVMRLEFFDASGVDVVDVPSPTLTFPTTGAPSDLATVRVTLPARATSGEFGLRIAPAARAVSACGPFGPIALLVDSLTLE